MGITQKFAGVLSAFVDGFTARLAPRPAAAPVQKGGSPYAGTGTPSYNPRVDVFGRSRAPSPLELVHESLSTAHACASLNSDLVAGARLRLYLRTRRGQRKSYLSIAGDTRPVSRARMRWLEKSAPRMVDRPGDVEELIDHPILSLLNSPNDAEADGVSLSQFSLFESTQRYLEIVGRAYWYVERAGLRGRPSAIWLLAPHQVTEIVGTGTDRLVDHYLFTAGRETQRYEVDEIIPFRMPDPYNPYLGGVSPLRSVFEEVMIFRRQRALTLATLSNGGRPDALWTPKGDTEGTTIGPNEAKRMRSIFRQVFAESGAGGIAVGEVPGSIEMLSWPKNEIYSAEDAKLTKILIANAFAVPTTKLDRADSTLASARTGDYAHAKDAGLPRCERMQAALTRFLLPMYDDGDERLFFAYDSVVPGDHESDRADVSVLITAKAITKNEVRAKFGLEDDSTFADQTAGTEAAGVPGADLGLTPPGARPEDDDGNESDDAPTDDAGGDTANAGGSDEDGKGKGSGGKKHPAHQQSGAISAQAGGDLRSTVGGSAAIRDLQSAYYGGTMPRDAAIANATLVFGFTQAEAEKLFPAEEPDAPGKDRQQAAPPGSSTGAPAGGGDDPAPGNDGPSFEDAFGDPAGASGVDSGEPDAGSDEDPAPVTKATPAPAGAAPAGGGGPGGDKKRDAHGHFASVESRGAKKVDEPKGRGSKAADGGGKSAAPKRSAHQTPKPASKAELAKRHGVVIDRADQRYAEEHNEPQFAKAVGGVSFPDGEPVDVVFGSGGVVQHGVELKTMLKGKNDKLTMNRYAQVRKAKWERDQKATMHTVVIDDRSVYNAGGEGVHVEANRTYYYRRGVAGSARVGSMHPCKSMAEVKSLMAMDEKKLPPAAQRTDGELRKGVWKEIADKDGKGFKNSKTGEIVRPKK